MDVDLCQQINWNRTWHIIYGWKDLPVGSSFWYSKSFIQWIGPWKYEQNYRKRFFFHQSSEKNISLLKTEMEVYETALCHHTHIYQIGAFKFRLFIRISENWPIQLVVMVNNTGISWLVILVLSPNKCNSPVAIVLYSNE